MEIRNPIINFQDPVLVTGAAGFIGARVVRMLLEAGFQNIRCLIRSHASSTNAEDVSLARANNAHIQMIKGNLLYPEDCIAATAGVMVVFHLAAGTGEKSFADAFMNSVVTTRNLLDACVYHGSIKRFVNVSSFAVYSNRNKQNSIVLDESAPVEERPELRGEAYCYAKLRQDQLVAEYGKKHGIPFVLVRPGAVYGPGKEGITGRVGRDMFGIFLHMGAGNTIPFTYVDNCAEAVVLAGVVPGVEGETFNVVDDDLPSSRDFLWLYKQQVKPLRTLYIPRFLSYVGCYLWERYSAWSRGQLPPVFNSLAWHAYWKGNIPANDKIKRRLGWRQRVSTQEGFNRLFESHRQSSKRA